jgi:hypothetical protein
MKTENWKCDVCKRPKQDCEKFHERLWVRTLVSDSSSLERSIALVEAGESGHSVDLCGECLAKLVEDTRAFFDGVFRPTPEAWLPRPATEAFYQGTQLVGMVLTFKGTNGSLDRYAAYKVVNQASGFLLKLAFASDKRPLAIKAVCELGLEACPVGCGHNAPTKDKEANNGD